MFLHRACYIHVTPLRNQHYEPLMRFNELQSPPVRAARALWDQCPRWASRGFQMGRVLAALSSSLVVVVLYGVSIAAIALNVNWCLDTNVFW